MTILTAVSLALLLQDPAAPAKGDDLAKELVGEYAIASGEEAGRDLPAAEIKGSLVRFSADRVVVTDKRTKEIFGATYTLGNSGTPRRVTLVSKLAPMEGTVAQGLIEKDGDTIRLIYALPGGKAPTEFKTGEKQLMFVMKRKPAEGSPKAEAPQH